MSAYRALVVAFGLVALAARGVAAETAAAGADPLERPRLASSPVAPGAMRLELTPAHLDISDGVLFPVVTGSAATREFVFLGSARFVLETADPVERHQLDLFTGGERLDEPVDEVVLAIADDEIAARLAGHAAAGGVPADLTKRAASLLSAWRASPDWRAGELESALFAASAGDAAARHFAFAWCHSPRLGRFYFEFDPWQSESVRIVQFVPPRLGDNDSDVIAKQIRAERWSGRLRTMTVADLGNRDTWFSTAPPGADGHAAPGSEGFEPDHYALQIEIDAYPENDVEATARIALHATSSGRVAVRLHLDEDLVAREVRDAAGGKLPFRQNGGLIVVLLPRPAQQGQPLTLEVDYGGPLFDKADFGAYRKRSTGHWYPHAGTADIATYEVAFRHAKSVGVLATGRLVSSDKDEGKVRDRYALDVPARWFAFEVGSYRLQSTTAGHVAITVGFLTNPRVPSEKDRAAVLATLADAITTYEKAFGPYPLDTLTAAMAPQDFSQGYLGFVSIAGDLVDGFSLPSAGPEPSQNLAHEIAHQWWGNAMTWAGYRDQWLSEALADFSAALFLRRAGVESEDKRYAGALQSIATKREILETTPDLGRPIEALGPVTLGTRLDSSLAAGRAYEPIVYGKGAMVLAMLGDLLQPAAFVAMLRELATRSRGRPIDTPTVIAALEKMSGRGLARFAREFIDGVGYPEINARYTVESGAGGHYVIRGTIDQIPRGFRRDRIEASGGGFILAPQFTAYQDADDASVPIHLLAAVEVKDPEPGGTVRPDSAATLRGYGLLVSTKGPTNAFEFEVPSKPVRVVFDPWGNVPAPVRDLVMDGKRGFRSRGAAFQSIGRFDDAVAAYRVALTSPLLTDSGGVARHAAEDLAFAGKKVDGRIHVQLARIALDRGDLDGARRELDDPTVSLMARDDPKDADSVAVVEGRIALARGDLKESYDRYASSLRLDFVQRESDLPGDLRRHAKFGEGVWGTGGDYLLLAVVAHRTGREDVCAEARAQARRMGSDVAAVEALHAAGAGPPAK
jgi:peptidase M1-like protein